MLGSALNPFLSGGPALICQALVIQKLWSFEISKILEYVTPSTTNQFKTSICGKSLALNKRSSRSTKDSKRINREMLFLETHFFLFLITD
jgi:hypothetical protein